MARPKTTKLIKQQLITTDPEVVKQFKKIVHMKRTTISGLLNQIMVEYIQTNADVIQQYDRIYHEE